MKQSLFDAVAGLPAMERIHKRFYDEVYVHPWLGQFFAGHDQTAIELRQTRFMALKMGADIKYPGKSLEIAHERMYITTELLEVRQALLKTAIEAEGIAPELVKRWLKIDKAFWGKLKNESLEAFRQIDLQYQKPLIVEKPEV